MSVRQDTILVVEDDKDIVNAHHGRIYAESELHKGSAFHIVLPI